MFILVVDVNQVYVGLKIQFIQKITHDYPIKLLDNVISHRNANMNTTSSINLFT